MRKFQAAHTEEFFPAEEIETWAEPVGDNATTPAEVDPWLHLLKGVWRGRTDLLPANAEDKLLTQPDYDEESAALPPASPENTENPQDKSFKDPAPSTITYFSVIVAVGRVTCAGPS